ncbi:hypothetical protein KIN20_025862 [Parelaphostrongylus tenuis]|uniref:Uncharacterized protein n=1 Tax=Parelaphostrongylus tenuis TaxID=148309 RepID=A0AAD5NB21_PARTN|nr:hypothetical protein KIN20_025862 [Parelaphostrongylus tenuis]
MAFNISTLLAAALDDRTTVRPQNDDQPPITKDELSDARMDRQIVQAQSDETQHG